MTQFKRYLCAALFGIAVSTLYGCGGNNPRGVKFTPEMLREGGVVVVAVVPAVESERSVRASLDHALLLEEAVRQEPGLKVRGAQQVLKVLGASLYAQMLSSFRFHEVAGAVYMDMIHNAMPGVRYLAYAWIRDDQAVHNNKPAESGTGLELFTTRAMTVSLYIYDMDSRQALVWAAALQDGATNRSRSSQSYEITENMYPPVPEQAKVLQKLFPALVRHLLGDS
jgi:hypothetical protein